MPDSIFFYYFLNPATFWVHLCPRNPFLVYFWGVWENAAVYRLICTCIFITVKFFLLINCYQNKLDESRFILKKKINFKKLVLLSQMFDVIEGLASCWIRHLVFGFLVPSVFHKELELCLLTSDSTMLNIQILGSWTCI